MRKIFSVFPTAFLPLFVVSLFPIHTVGALFTRVCILGFALVFTRRQLIRPAFILMSSWLFLSTLWSVNSSQSFAATFQWCSYLALYILFRYQVFPETALRWGLRLLVLCAIVLSIYGLYQLLYGYDEYFLVLETAAESLLPAPRADMHEWLTALSGRVFSRFALPSQFAVYLLMLFPLHGVLIVRERRIGLKFFWGGGLILNSIMFVYTKSFGAWLTLFCLLACGILLFLVRHQAVTWQRILAVSLIIAPLFFGTIYLIGILRGQHLWNFQGNNPLWFRLLNWKAAANMWRDHFFGGTGLSTFGILYPHYMLPGANESNYAHNSYLQLGAEYGAAGMLLILWLIIGWGYTVYTMLKKHSSSETRNPPSQPSSSQPFFTSVRYASGFGGLAFLLHNIIDFDLYVFPLAVVGIALLALTINTEQQSPQSPQQSRKSFLTTACVGCSLLIVTVFDWRQTETQQQYEMVRQQVQAQHYEDAVEISHKIIHTWPVHPAYQALAGSIALFQQRPAEAQQNFQAAIQSDPHTPWFHAGLAEAYLAEYNLSLAYVESRQASELFPQKPDYGQRMQEIRDAFSAL